MVTVYALIRNFEGPWPAANFEARKPDELQFENFRIWKIRQGIPIELECARELFKGAQVSYGDCVYERNYDAIPGRRDTQPDWCGFGHIPAETEDALLLFRLYKPGDIAFVDIRIRTHKGETFRQYPYRFTADFHSTYPYRMESIDCARLDDFIKMIAGREAWNSQWFKIARRFFMYGASKEFNPSWDEADRVVDYTTALEAALVPEHGKFIGRRLRRRAERLLALQSSSIPQLDKLLVRLYRIRSLVSHGGIMSDEEKKMLEVESPRLELGMREILRAALCHLPADELRRKQVLQGFYQPSDKDYADALLVDFDSLTSGSEKQRVVEEVITRQKHSVMTK